MGRGRSGEPSLRAGRRGVGWGGVSILHIVFCESTDVVCVDIFRSFRKKNTQFGPRSLGTLKCVCDLDKVPYLLETVFLTMKGKC